MKRTEPGADTVGILYPAPRNVAYSSLFYRYLKFRLTEEGIYGGTIFLENKSVYMERGTWGNDPRGSRVFFVSLPFEIMYRDYAELMLRLGFNVWRRRARDRRIIIAGGPAVSGNPLPVLPLVDAVLIGEIENVEHEIFGLVSEAREDALEGLANISGMLVPSLAGRNTSLLPVRRNYIKNLDEYLVPFDQTIPPGVEPVWGRSYAIESSRGCSRGCRFCLEGFVFRPKRDLGKARLIEHVDYANQENYKKINFYSLSFFDNPWAEDALHYAVESGLEVSVPSIRVDTLTRDRIRIIREGGQRTLTLAPETGSRRICNAIKKGFDPERTLQVIEEAVDIGFKQIKLYFIVGFPGETHDDLRESARLIEKAAKVLRSAGGRVKVSVNPFVPKPFTPLQWLPFIGHIEARRRVLVLHKTVKRLGGEASKYDPKWARIQAILSRGDTSVARLIVEWARIGGGLGDFRRAVKHVGINVDKFLTKWSVDYIPPWHKLVEHPFASLRLLRREYEIFADTMGIPL